MRVLDLFSGGGGFTRGAVEAGMRVMGAVEIDSNAAATYRQNFPSVTVFETDIRYLRTMTVEKSIGKVDVIIGGPPCEAYTPANPKRRKDPLERLYDDPLGRLVLEFVRFVGDLQPEAFVMENVLGLIDGELKGALRDEFGAVGYKVHFNVLNAEEYGVPSHRTRVFVSNLWLRPRKRRPPSAWEAIEDLFFWPKIPNHTFIPLPQKIERRVHKLRWGKAAVLFRGAGGIYRNYVRLEPTKIAPTVMGHSRFIHPFADRLLTPREQARLMGFPDGHVFLGGIESVFNQIGEAVPPPLARSLLEEVHRKLGAL